MRWVLLLALTGCFIPRETTVGLGVYAAPPAAGPPGAVVLVVTESYATVHVDASRPRRCYRELRRAFEHRLEVANGPLASPLSMLVTDIVNSAGPVQVDHFERTVHVTSSECPIAAGGAVIEVVLPSGKVLHAAANELGLVSIAIPTDEPDCGVVVVRSEGTEVRVPYSRAART